jgi:hypothetical protein
LLQTCWNNWEQAVGTQLVDRLLPDLYACPILTIWVKWKKYFSNGSNRSNGKHFFPFDKYLLNDQMESCSARVMLCLTQVKACRIDQMDQVDQMDNIFFHLIKSIKRKIFLSIWQILVEWSNGVMQCSSHAVLNANESLSNWSNGSSWSNGQHFFPFDKHLSNG